MSNIAWSTYSNNQTTPAIRRSLSGTKPYVVVIFGRTGVGVSSLVNLIIGHPVSVDHPNAKSTQQPKPKSHTPTTLARSDKQFCLYEVPGFCGHSSDATILGAIREIDQREGIDLFIYCLRKQKATVMPGIVRHVRESVDVPMIAVVTELERFEAVGGMEDWWDAPLGCGRTNGKLVEELCFGGDFEFDAHACVTTLPRREVDLVDKLRKRRDVSEERIRGLILRHCDGHKRQASGPPDPHPPCCLSGLFIRTRF